MSHRYPFYKHIDLHIKGRKGWILAEDAARQESTAKEILARLKPGFARTVASAEATAIYRSAVAGIPGRQNDHGQGGETDRAVHSAHAPGGGGARGKSISAG